MITAQQKENLRLKRISFAVGIKIGQERVLFKDFQNNFGVERGLKQAGEGRLTNSDDPFDGNVHAALQN